MENVQNKGYGKVFDSLQGEFQQMLNIVSNYKKQISEAKTSTKKAYYQKKIEKLRPKILQIADYMQTLIDTKAQPKE